VPAARVSVELFGVDGRWNEIPIPLEDVYGRIEFLGDPRLLIGTGFDLRCSSPLGARVAAVGRVQADPAATAQLAHLERLIESIAVDVDGLLLKGADRDAIVAVLPEIAANLDPYVPQGRIRLTYRGATARAGAARHWQVEATPEEVVLTPEMFPIRASDVRGRVLVGGVRPPASSTERPSVRTRIAPLAGTWLPGTSIAAFADVPSSADARVEIYAAGIDASNPSLAGAFRESQSQGLEGGHSGLGLSALNVDGRVDFNAEFITPSQLPRTSESIYRVHLRQNDVKTNVGGSRFELDGLAGILEQREGVLLGERVTATLAGTPIELRNARFEERGDVYRLETSIEALEFPIDRQHLVPFLDEPTIAALVDELGWSGTVDLRNTSLLLTGSTTQSGGEARMSGDLVPRAMQIDFGVPFAIDRAAVRVEELIYRRDSVRATATVEALSGRVSDRRLEDASFRLEYDDPRLSILGFSGLLEGGKVATLAASRERPAFAIDLVAPFRFELAVGLSDVDVGGLLRGLFESDFASRGKLAGRLELDGDLRRLTGIRGRGNLALEDTTLWSIPVVRDVLSQLGLDATAVFESVRTDLTIERGVIATKQLEISSPLLKLVGDGTLDFDGRLHHDLEVRYGVLDWLGWINRIVYWLHDNIARLAVRGDMARPRVELKGMLGQLRGAKGKGRDLPLPALTPLPERF